MSPEELTVQYSPSQWTQRFQDSTAVIENHIEVITAASDTAKRKVPFDCGVRYGPKEGQMLDVFGGLLLPHDAPILIYIHGGYWQELSRELSAYCVVPQYQSGIRVIVVGYDLSPTGHFQYPSFHSTLEQYINNKKEDVNRGDSRHGETRNVYRTLVGKSHRKKPHGRSSVTLSEIVEEIKQATEYILNMASECGVRSVWFCGHSAGAHLVAMLLFSGWLDQLDDSVCRLAKGFVLISGIYDLTPLVSTYINDALKLSREEAQSLSPMLLDIPAPVMTKLRVLIAVGEHDSPAFQLQSCQFAEKLRKQGQQVDFTTVAGMDHFDIVENLQLGDFVLTKAITGLVTDESEVQ